MKKDEKMKKIQKIKPVLIPVKIKIKILISLWGAIKLRIAGLKNMGENMKEYEKKRLSNNRTIKFKKKKVITKNGSGGNRKNTE